MPRSRPPQALGRLGHGVDVGEGRARRDVVAVLDDEPAARSELLEDPARRLTDLLRRPGVDEHRVDVAEEDDPSAEDRGDAVEVDLVAETLELVDRQVVAEDLEQVIAPAAHVEAEAAVEM